MSSVPIADLHLVTLIRSQGLYWGAFDASVIDYMRDFSERLEPETQRIAAQQHDYELMARNRLHEQLELEGLAFVFIPMMFGVYQLDFSVFFKACRLDFDIFATDEYTRDRNDDVCLNLSSGELCIAELTRPFVAPTPVAALQRGNYRVACLRSIDQEDKHAFLEGDYPATDGPDFKFYLQRQHPTNVA